jgi:DHA2 family multidrug resistance protein
MASNFVVALFLQIHLQYTPLQAAWMLMPTAVIIGIMSVVTGRLADLVPARLLVIFGMVGSTLLMFQHATITPVTSVEAITFWFAVRGVSRSFTIAPLTTGSLATLPEAAIRMGSGLLSLNRGIASAGSIALTTAVLQNRLAERVLHIMQDESAAPFAAEDLLQQFFATFQGLGDFAEMAQIKAGEMLQQLLTAEAALHSYHDTFVLIGWISALGILPAFWMRQPRPPQTTRPAPSPHSETPSQQPR